MDQGRGSATGGRGAGEGLDGSPTAEPDASCDETSGASATRSWADPGAAADDAPPAGVPRPPQVYGWEPVRLLGAGAQAEVWLVRDPSGEEAALKVARPGEDDAPIAAEADVLAGGGHPHLLRCLGTAATDRGTGVLSEHRPAGTVADLVRRAGPLTPAQAVTVLVPVAQALAHLHGRGIVHGDVTPANVLFDVDGSPALADVAVARVVGGRQGLGATPGFAAPEVVDAVAEETGDRADRRGPGAASATPAADMHAWGALGWFAMTGRAPGPQGHRAPLPVLVPDAPAELALLLDAALDPDPARRPDAQSAAEAAYAAVRPEPVPLHEAAPAEIAHLLPTVEPGRRTGGRAARHRPWPGRRGLLVGVGALAAGAATVLAVAALAGGRGPGASVDVTGAATAAPGSSGADTVHGTPAEAGAPGPGTVEPAPASSAQAPALPAGPAAALAGDPAGLAVVLERIAAARTAALTDPRVERLDAYAVTGSPAWERDRRIQDDLVQGGFSFSGLVVRLEADGVPGVEGAERLRVPARIVTGAHTVQDDRGATAQQVPESVEPVDLVLASGAGGWRVERVEAR